MSAHSKRLGRDLAKAWLNERHHFLEEGKLGERTLALVDQALAEGCLDQAMAHAFPMLAEEPQAWMSINREAERRAGRWLWDPRQVGRDDAEVLLLAMPCMGDMAALERWMDQPRHRQALELACKRQVAVLAGREEADVEALQVMPRLAHPGRMAALTAAARRALMLELAGDGHGVAMEALFDRTDAGSNPNPPAPGLGLLVLACVVRTHWGRESRNSAVASPIFDLADGVVDEDLLDQAQEQWHQATQGLWADAGSLQAGQPVAINQALLAALHDRLLGMRVPGDPSQALPTLLEDGPEALLPVLRVDVEITGRGLVQIRAQMADGQRTAEVSGHWAFVEGQQAFHGLLTKALCMEHMGLGAEEDGDPTDPQSLREAARGTHPAWERALPAPRRLH